MKSSVALMVFAGLAVSSWAEMANAQTVGLTYVFVPNYVVTERNGTLGANKARSYAAAGAMGAQGHSNYNAGSQATWESTILPICQANSGVTLWPEGCNPNGMAATLANKSGHPWTTYVYSDADQSAANNRIVSALKNIGSPAVVPIFGQADHWVTITEVSAKYQASGVYAIQNIKYFDGGPAWAVDSSGNSYSDGKQSWAGSSWNLVYYRVLTAINPGCDPNCTSDPFFNKFLVTWEPPPNTPLDSSIGVFAKAPGVLVAGQHMSAHMASMRVWDALMASGIDMDAEIWPAVQGGTAGAAWEVNGVWPSGDAWDYYLVPILSNTTTAIAFVMLDSLDGSFHSIFVPDNPIAYTPITMQQAKMLAHTTLANGERLTGGYLTWDPSDNALISKSPSFPYYEFGIVGPGNQDGGVVRVSHANGMVARSQ